MPSKGVPLSSKAHLPFKSTNKARRQQLHINQKRARDVLRREERFARKKEETKNPKLREERLRTNVPETLESKRKWDDVEDEPEDGGLGVAFNVERLKRRKLAEEQDLVDQDDSINSEADHDSDHDSMLDDDEDEDEGIDGDEDADEDGTDQDVDDVAVPPDADHDDPLPSKSQIKSATAKTRTRASSPPARSTTSTNLSLAPAALSKKFPSLFLPAEELPAPKVLVTTSINSTLHHEAGILVNLFPNAEYVRRSSHRYGHKFSIKEISAFAANRGFTTLVVLEEDLKRPSGMVIVHLPIGPTFHFSISNWYESKQLPGHGRPTNHIPELILNNFVTPLGLLTAHLFRSLYPSNPELQGRQVVTLHNQRDFIFLRRHRYVFREKRERERSVVGADGKVMEGVEEIRAGLQELGPRLTLKLRRVDKGIQRASGQEWEWKGKTDRVRTKFQL